MISVTCGKLIFFLLGIDFCRFFSISRAVTVVLVATTFFKSDSSFSRSSNADVCALSSVTSSKSLIFCSRVFTVRLVD